MALLKNINSYVSVIEADFYFENRIDATAWTEASETQKEQALITATANLDNMNWTGVAISETQNLAFPRVGTYFDPKLGIEVSFTEEIPSRIKVAVYEMAYHLLNNDGLLDSTGDVKSIHVGAIKLIDIQSSSKTPHVVMSSIKPMLVNGGANLWWRAN